MDEKMKTKRCSQCGIRFPADTHSFYADRQHKDGLSSACKKCHNLLVAPFRQVLCSSSFKDVLEEYMKENKNIFSPEENDRLNKVKRKKWVFLYRI